MKKAPSKTDPTPALQTINPLRITTCPTISRKSTLSYELGQDAAKALHYRIVSCDGGGFFSPEWIAWTAIQSAIKKSVGPLTSLCLRPLFKGKSVDTSGFLLAVLVAEGLLEPLPRKIRHFRLTGNSPSSVEVKPRSTPLRSRKPLTPRPQRLSLVVLTCSPLTTGLCLLISPCKAKVFQIRQALRTHRTGRLPTQISTARNPLF